MRHGWLAAGLIALAGSVGLVSAAAAQEGAALVGKDAPDIQTKEWINSDGRTAIADFKGEVVLIESWATW